MNFKALSIPGVWEIELDPKIDDRGFFMRMYDKDIFREHGLPTDWVQESRAFTKNKGTIRGLHFLYPPHNEAKLIAMLGGEGFWAFIDLRKGSPTLGKWGSVVLSGEKHNMLFIPRGFANGVCTLSSDCHVLYHMDTAYDDSAKSEIAWNDPDIGIQWPMASTSAISSRDEHAGSFKEFLLKSGGGLVI